MHISKIHFENSNVFSKQAKFDIVKNYHYPGFNKASTMAHKLSHALEYDMVLKEFGLKIQKMPIETARKVVDKFKSHSIATSIKKEALKSMGLPEYGRETYNSLKKLGRYSMENNGEFFAEAMSDALMSKNPQEISKKVLEITRKRLGE